MTKNIVFTIPSGPDIKSLSLTKLFGMEAELSKKSFIYSNEFNKAWKTCYKELWSVKEMKTFSADYSDVPKTSTIQNEFFFGIISSQNSLIIVVLFLLGLIFSGLLFYNIKQEVKKYFAAVFPSNIRLLDKPLPCCSCRF